MKSIFISDEFVEEATRLKRGGRSALRMTKYNKRVLTILRAEGRWGVVLATYTSNYAYNQKAVLSKRFAGRGLEWRVIPTPDKAGNPRWSLIARKVA
jgi:hypothetical protein